MPKDLRELMTESGALWSAIDGTPLHGGAGWPVGMNVEGHLRRVVAAFDRLPAVVVEHAEFDHYGSGYASFVDVAVTKRDGSERRDREDGEADVECLDILLCRLAPVVCVLRPSIRSRGPGRGSHSLPEVNRVVTDVDRAWAHEFDQVGTVLGEHGLTSVGTDILTLPLPGGLTVETYLADAPFTIFDGWFHWMD